MINSKIADISLRRLLAKEEIAEVTLAYCRGVDRVDEELVKSTFHKQSTMISGVFDGDGHTFATEICKILKSTFEQTFHSITNQWIEVDLDNNSAKVENYVLAVCTVKDGENGYNEVLTGGRYLDEFSYRDGAWKIAYRSFVMDWNLVQPSSRTLDAAEQAAKSGQLIGCQDKNDPVYRLWN